jgi:HD-GYP domain-containing protein (c-di-GMP phosphodiesterase class II)
MAQMATEPSLHTHALNTCQYGLALARDLGALSADDLEGFGTGILLMDVGMLEIPAALAFKDVPLSFDEWTLIKRHPALGLEAIDALEGVTEIVREVTFGHHERIDGSGYPQGLRGREVTVPMRIVGVAETFTALTTGRAYRPAMSTFEAIRQMRTEMRAGLDPRVVEALIRLVSA